MVKVFHIFFVIFLVRVDYCPAQQPIKSQTLNFILNTKAEKLKERKLLFDSLYIAGWRNGYNEKRNELDTRVNFCKEQHLLGCNGINDPCQKFSCTFYDNSTPDKKIVPQIHFIFNTKSDSIEQLEIRLNSDFESMWHKNDKDFILKKLIQLHGAKYSVKEWDEERAKFKRLIWHKNNYTLIYELSKSYDQNSLLPEMLRFEFK